MFALARIRCAPHKVGGGQTSASRSELRCVRGRYHSDRGRDRCLFDLLPPPCGLQPVCPCRPLNPDINKAFSFARPISSFSLQTTAMAACVNPSNATGRFELLQVALTTSSPWPCDRPSSRVALSGCSVQCVALLSLIPSVKNAHKVDFELKLMVALLRRTLVTVCLPHQD